MLEIDEKLESKLKELNSNIRKSYMDNIVIKNVRSDIVNSIGQIIKISSYSYTDKSKVLSIVGVDGSINTVGLTFPHYISLMRAIAKSTVMANNIVSLCDIHTPLIDKSYLNENPRKLPYEVVDEKTCSNKLALLELQAAYDSIDALKPDIIFMDGSLTRFLNASRDKWLDFIRKVKSNNIIVIGVIEEIRTAEICSRLKVNNLSELYDRDILFGVLEKSEMFILNDWNAEGINKCFMRASNDPGVIGIDFMEYDRNVLEFVLSIVLSLTPDDSRGIPIWLDIVDSDVKLTDSMTKALIENYIDKDIVEKLIKPKRENRKI